jgi:hypothetical protein
MGKGMFQVFINIYTFQRLPGRLMVKPKEGNGKIPVTKGGLRGKQRLDKMGIIAIGERGRCFGRQGPRLLRGQVKFYTEGRLKLMGHGLAKMGRQIYPPKLKEQMGVCIDLPGKNIVNRRHVLARVPPIGTGAGPLHILPVFWNQFDMPLLQGLQELLGEFPRLNTGEQKGILANDVINFSPLLLRQGWKHNFYRIIGV